MLVLIVEDDADLADAIGRALEWEDCNVVTRPDGELALEWLRTAERLPDLILLDYRMPDMDGATFRRVQLSCPQLAAIPVVVVTAQSITACADIARELGCAVIAKPMSTRVLRDAIQSALEPGTPPTRVERPSLRR